MWPDRTIRRKSNIFNLIPFQLDIDEKKLVGLKTVGTRLHTNDIFELHTPTKCGASVYHTSVCLLVSDPVLIGCDKSMSCDIRMIETLIRLKSSNWLNLDD